MTPKKISRNTDMTSDEEVIAQVVTKSKMTKEQKAAAAALAAELKAKKLAFDAEKKAEKDARAAKKAFDAEQPKEITCSVAGCGRVLKGQKALSSHMKFDHAEIWAITHPTKIETKGNVQLVSVDRPSIAQAMVDAGMTNIPSGIDIVMSDPMISAPKAQEVTITKKVEVNTAEVSLDQLFRDIMAVEKAASDSVARTMEAWMRSVYSPVVADLKKYSSLLPGAEVVESNLKVLADTLGGEQVKFHSKVVAEIAMIRSGIEKLQGTKEALEKTEEYKQAMKLHLQPAQVSAIKLGNNTPVHTGPVVAGDINKFLANGYTYQYQGTPKKSFEGLMPYAQAVLRDRKDKETVAAKLESNKLPEICTLMGITFTSAEMAQIADAIVSEAMKRNDPVSVSSK